MSDDDMEDYGFEYSDEEQEEEDVDIENQYYNSKGMLEGDGGAKEALEGFQQVLTMEGGTKGEWGFKALKQIVKLHFKAGDADKMMDAYRQMLGYIDSAAVTRNASEKKLNSLLDFVGASTDAELLQRFYKTTLRALETAKNDRLWFKTSLKLCGLWFRLREYGRMARVLKELHRSCQRADGGGEDPKKGTQQLEVYALEIQMATEQRNGKRLKELYKAALGVKSAIPHPRILGVVRECGGKMHMRDRNWQDAATDFFEAFRAYDEAGSHRRVACLKYLVLASMLMQSSVDPFDSQEARPYKADPEVVAMTDLVAAYQANDIRAFEKVLRARAANIMGDGFIRQYVEDLLRNIRTQVLLRLIRPYTRVRLPFLASQLNAPLGDVESLLVGLILDGKVDGRIDQINQLLELGTSGGGGSGGASGGGGATDAAAAGAAGGDAAGGDNTGASGAGAGGAAAKYAAMAKWARQVGAIHAAIANKLA